MRTALASIVLIAACGGAQPASEPAPTDVAAAPAEAAPTEAPATAAAATMPPGFDTPWTEMKRKERVDVMKKNVVPQVGAAFTNFDPDHFDHPDCTTCHGDGALEGKFEMPNPELPALDFNSPEWPAYAAEHAQVLEFMNNEVVPLTAKALGVPPYDPATQQGFGCFNCHPAP